MRLLGFSLRETFFLAVFKHGNTANHPRTQSPAESREVSPGADGSRVSNASRSCSLFEATSPNRAGWPCWVPPLPPSLPAPASPIPGGKHSQARGIVTPREDFPREKSNFSPVVPQGEVSWGFSCQALRVSPLLYARMPRGRRRGHGTGLDTVAT